MTEAEARARLETYAPQLCFNTGEAFLPTQVEAYLRACTLHRHVPFWTDQNLTARWDAEPERAPALPRLAGTQTYLQLVPPTWAEQLTPAFFVLLLTLLTTAGWIMRGLEGSIAAAAAAIVLIIWLRVTPTKGGAVLLFTALLLLLVSAGLGLLLRPLSPMLAVVCGVALLLWLTLGFLVAFWGQLPGLIIRASSKLNQRRRNQAYAACANWQTTPPVYPYYGRVVTEGRWTTLQYHFFYAFNDWANKSGLNYHEGDWETVMVFLKDGQPEPYGVGYSAHHQGEFRAWSQADHVEGTCHPRVFVAHGSHANYPQRGVILPADLLPAWLHRVIDFFERARHRADEAAAAPAPGTFSARLAKATQQTTLPLSDPLVQQYQSRRRASPKQAAPPAQPSPDHEARVEPLDAESFRETALGAGPSIGPGGLYPWTPVVLTDSLPAWVEYRGLWGVRGWIADESGPPGPKWDRASRCAQFPRLRWEAPLRWLRLLQQAAGPADPDLPA